MLLLLSACLCLNFGEGVTFQFYFVLATYVFVLADALARDTLVGDIGKGGFALLIPLIVHWRHEAEFCLHV